MVWAASFLGFEIVGKLLGVSFLLFEMRIDIDIGIGCETCVHAVYHTCCIHPFMPKKKKDMRNATQREKQNEA
jgi:hypothetical protein